MGGSVLGFSVGFALALTGPAGALSVGGTTAGGPDTACVVMDLALEGRMSPLDSLSFRVGSGVVKVCYGRPSARGRTMIGGNDVPYGRLWRTGANEPTMIHVTEPVRLAGLHVPAGSYSLYTIPDGDEWVVIVNRSITQWGHIARYTSRVRELEVGRATVRAERLEHHVETMTFRSEPRPEGGAMLLLEWEHTRIRLSVMRGSS